ncbi:MAG: hypothetical protein ACFFFK_12590 [Candidatus Thorarchaeota archaeon]
MVFKNGDTSYYVEDVVVRVLVVGSCGKKKAHSDLKEPKCHAIDKRRNISYWKRRFSKLSMPARDMYIGPQNTELVKAVDMLRTIPGVTVQFVILSAGFGILQEYDLVPPYDCSFTSMNMAEVRKRSDVLRLKTSLTRMIDGQFDFIYLALGKRYLNAIGTDVLSMIRAPTVIFHGQSSENLVRVPCASDTVKGFSKRGHKIHGVVGFKGDLLRILVSYALGKQSPKNEVKKWTNTNHLRTIIYQLGGLNNPNVS